MCGSGGAAAAWEDEEAVEEEGAVKTSRSGGSD